MQPVPRPAPAAPLSPATVDCLNACVALSRAGCRLLAAHVHDGIPVIVVDRRPPTVGVRPGTLRVSGHTADYHAAFGPVQIAWTEPRRGAA